jgi:hypothetical protein
MICIKIKNKTGRTTTTMMDCAYNYYYYRLPITYHYYWHVVWLIKIKDIVVCGTHQAKGGFAYRVNEEEMKIIIIIMNNQS